MTKAQPHICAVCYIVCDKVGGIWAHISEVAGTSDHPAVPIPYDDERVRTKCDFCGQDDVHKADLFALPARDFKIPMLLDATSKGAWAACALCAETILDGGWSAMVERYITLHQPGPHQPLMREWLKQLYAILSAHQTGPVRRWQPGDEVV